MREGGRRGGREVNVSDDDSTVRSSPMFRTVQTPLRSNGQLALHDLAV